MMNAHAHLAVASSAFAHALPPSSKLFGSGGASIRSRCTPRPSLPMPSLGRLPTTLQAATTTALLHPTTTTTPVVTADRAAAASFAGTDRFHAIGFHHVEFWCNDAASAAGRFSLGLGLPLAAKSDLTTGNTAHASRLLRSRSGPLALLFTAPYAAPQQKPGAAADDATAASSPVVPSFSADAARRFAGDHSLAVRAVAVRVSDAAEAFRASVAAGARPAFAPAELGHGFVFAEVELYGDAVLRFVSYPDDTNVAFLPGFENVVSSESECPDLGLSRFDHISGGVPEVAPVAAYLAGFTGFHEIHRFKAEEVGTAESSINGLVLANSTENVLLTVLEPVHGTKRRSQMQTFLDHHGGPGVQHMAMASDDLLRTLRGIRARSSMGGFEFLPPPPPGYYVGVRRLAGDVLSEAQINECEELGVRVDRDDNGGVVLQIVTKGAGDRPTLLLEFIQRIGCLETDESGKEYQRSVCGGFLTDNIIQLVKSIEDYDKTIDGPPRVAS